ncbi:MAG: ZIP family metal transporter [Chloroflexota bacterium]
MSLATTVMLGALAGFTIYLGLPVARLKKLAPAGQAFLNALAVGILFFLLWDILSKAIEPIDAALQAARKGHANSFVVLVVLFAVGLGVGLLSLVYVKRGFARASAKSGAEVTPAHLALMIAVGIGLHNFSEGLAIGQSSRSGAIALATLLIIGFGLHNTTEGFGIAAPLATGTPPSWGFLGLMGLIGGGPTFLGTVLGYSFVSTPVFVLFLALAAGSVFYVVAELLHVGRRFELPGLLMWGVLVGFLAGFGTDLILTWAGA